MLAGENTVTLMRITGTSGRVFAEALTVSKTQADGKLMNLAFCA